MTEEHEKLQELSKYWGQWVIVNANNSRLLIAHIGKTVIGTNDSSNKMQLQGVYHIAWITKNLFPVAQLTESGNFVVFGLEDIKDYRELKILGTPFMEGWKENSIYVMFAESTYVDKVNNNEMMDLLHEKPGHVGYYKLKTMMSKQMLKGLPQLEVKVDNVCSGCQYEKAHYLPYDESKYKAEEAL